MRVDKTGVCVKFTPRLIASVAQVSPVPHNQQQPGWTDVFDVQVCQTDETAPEAARCIFYRQVYIHKTGHQRDDATLSTRPTRGAAMRSDTA